MYPISLLKLDVNDASGVYDVEQCLIVILVSCLKVLAVDTQSPKKLIIGTGTRVEKEEPRSMTVKRLCKC